MIVAIWIVTVPFSHQWVQNQFNSLDFPNSNFGSAVSFSALSFSGFILPSDKHPTIAWNQVKTTFPSFSPSRCLNMRHYKILAAVSIIRCATHRYRNVRFHYTSLHCSCQHVYTPPHEDLGMVELRLHTFFIRPRLTYMVTSNVCQL